MIIVVCIEGYDTNELCKSIINAFSESLNDFYSQKALEKGYVTAKNRHGTEERFGLATLSIAGVTNRCKEFANVLELSEYATKLKARCKEIWDNCYMIE